MQTALGLRMDVDDLSPEDPRSFRLNEASLAHAWRDWAGASGIIGRSIERMRGRGGVAPAYVERCAELLKAGPAVMTATFLALTGEGQALRSVHPLAGLLPPHERHGIARRTLRARAREAS